MVQPLTPPANNFVAKVRKIYNPIGFQKGYNFILWFIFAGALMGFVLARFQYLNIPGIFCNPNAASTAAPGECYYYMNFDRYKIGIRLHLYCVLPAGFLTCWQFTPVIRHKFMLFHRINGYIILTLSLFSTVGALMIGRRSFGGSLATQVFFGVLAILFIGSLTMAYINIKCLQIDQHRAWMLRAWFYAGSIITLRIIFILAAMVISRDGGYYDAMPCDKLASFLDTADLPNLFPDCLAFLNGTDLNAQTVVPANLYADNAAGAAAALDMSFGMAGWLALAMHAVGIEIYLHLTPRESARLRTVSYQRQLEAGYKNAGYAGLTVQRFGDADKFVPPALPTSVKTPRESDITLGGLHEVKPVADAHGDGGAIGLVPTTTVRPAVSNSSSDDTIQRRIV